MIHKIQVLIILFNYQDCQKQLKSIQSLQQISCSAFDICNDFQINKIRLELPHKYEMSF